MLWLLAAHAHAQVQRFVWAAGVRHATLQAISPLTQVATDAAGNTYVSGLLSEIAFMGRTRLIGTSASMFSIYDAYVAKLSPDGQWLWAAQLHSTTVANAMALKIDPQGRPTLAGYYRGTTQLLHADSTAGPVLPNTGHYELFTAQLDANDGHWLWAASSTTTGTVAAIPAATASLGLAFDATGRPLVVGTTDGTTVFGAFGLVAPANAASYFVASLANGTWNSLLPLPTITGPRTDGLRPFLASTGELTVVGRANGPLAFGPLAVPAALPAGTAVVAHATATGSWQWAATALSTSSITANASTTDAAGSTWVGGSFSGTITLGTYSATSVGQEDAWVGRLDAAGNWQGLTTAGSPANDAIQALAARPGGGLIATGDLGGPATFGTIAVAQPRAYGGFVASLAVTGAWESAVPMAGALGIATALLPTGRVVVAGSFVSTATLGSFQLSTIGTSNAGFCAALDLVQPTAVRTSLAAAAIALYPSPAHGHATLALPAAAATLVTLLDALGRPARTYPIPAHAPTATLDLTGLAPGLYVVRCGPASGKLVVE
ncbi:hypothetical protein [Hymenobacter terricola]|uniref:hypothetical protein n=1 Tax=Hymenobacter terricola TaxID=2819236 RepID=UPI001B313E45|nr:hypothetical protein [Hymenobacter terricola]